MIVCYSVFVGKYDGRTPQDHINSENEDKKVIINVFLAKKEIENAEYFKTFIKHGRKRERKKKKQAKHEGKTIFVRAINKGVRSKQASLRKQKRSKNVLLEGVFLCYEIFGFLKIFFKIVIIFDRNYKDNAFTTFFKPENRKLTLSKVTNLLIMKINKPKKNYEPKISKYYHHTSDKKIRSLTTKALLVRSNVERNPGPQNQNPGKMKNIDFLTYNCNGMANKNKLKRIISKSNKIVEKGGVVMLQETHITKDNQISFLTKNDFQISPFRSNSAGVITLYGKNYKTIHSSNDKEGRQLYTVIQEGEIKFLVVNIYCYNDHKKSIKQIEEVYCKILEITGEIPDCHIILGGDFNSCMTQDDYMNRKKSQAEEELTKLIGSNNALCNLIDSYNLNKVSPGYTWNRGNCYSRLDYIYISSELSNKVISSEVDWAFEKSDHAAVKTTINIQTEIRKGPGIVKVNVEILRDNIKRDQIRIELEVLLQQIPSDWNGHMKLEYAKVAIRSTFANHVNIKRIENNTELENLEYALNDIELLKQKVVRNLNKVQSENNNKIALEKVEYAKTSIKRRLEAIRSTIAASKDFRANAKWYEHGEKSNKFFFDQVKFKAKQKLIGEIADGALKYVGQSEVMNGIRNFYQKLYSKEDRTDNLRKDNLFFEKCNKLSDVNKQLMDEQISLKEMYKALTSCKNTAPGPDGIPYLVYKVFWGQLGPILKEAWDYSLLTGKLPASHEESIITLLPKEGKDIRDIKNWRPITLSNCDAKIITKAFAMRLNPILESIIDPSQTAYVPGRSVMDNTRCNKYIIEHCRRNNTKAAIVSLDAKKAFDSVDHKYIDMILENYGFGDNFRRSFKTLYSSLSAKILVNGYFSEKIRIARGVKQGDALSCAIFILCIDPLIRNLNSNKKIKKIEVTNSNSVVINHKACGFADDVNVICKNDEESIKEIFSEYQRLTDKSGLTLNADKTEIMNINGENKIFYIRYDNRTFCVKTISNLKICGIYYSNKIDEEYKFNVHDKINKLKLNLKKWEVRRLTFEGKSLIIKTFGISQLIYNMQCITFHKEQLVQIERLIFAFLWGNNNTESNQARDRIERAIMKNEHSKGGLNITDIDCLNKSLKLRQYIRACRTSHTVRDVQLLCMHKSKNINMLAQDFHLGSHTEAVCQIAYETLNIITNYTREKFYGEDENNINSIIAVNQISNTDIKAFLFSKKKVYLSCIFEQLKSEGISNYLDLVTAAETEMSRKKSQTLEMFINAFPKYYRDVANSFDENINLRQDNISHVLNAEGFWVRIEEITTKELQWLLKNAMHKIKDANFGARVRIADSEVIDIMKFRSDCKNPQLRNIHFRLIHNDFYTHEKMFKYKMTNTPNCPRCNHIETSKHMLWECDESRKIWALYNDILKKVNLQNMIITSYEDIFKTESINILSIIKMKIIKEFIQIIRPHGWTSERINNIICQARKTEIYNAKIKNEYEKTIKKWKVFENLDENIILQPPS